MNPTIVIDWKPFAAFGGIALVFYTISKLDSDKLEKVLLHAIDAYKEYATAIVQKK